MLGIQIKMEHFLNNFKYLFLLLTKFAILFSIEEKWISDISPCKSWKIEFKVNSVLFYNQSHFQKIEIIENTRFGRMLFLDGLVQTTEADEYIYHEMITHVPLLTHADPKDVLIIGGGDGGVLREVLRHSRVETVTLVEIDEMVIHACKKHLPQISQGSFDDPRVHIINQDGLEFIKNTKNKYDVIICDSTVNIGPGETLFTSEFYYHCSDSLKPKGILTLQGGVAFYDVNQIPTITKKLKSYFREISIYTCSIPSYGGGLLTYFLAGNGALVVSSTNLVANMGNIHGKLRYYTPYIHQASFHLPLELEENFQKSLKVCK